MRRLISSATFLLMAVMGLLGAVAVVLVAVLPWPRVVGAPAVVSSDVRSSVAVFALLFLLGLPVSVAQKVHWGLQEGLTANLWLTLGAVLTILGLLVCVSARLPVPYLVAASTGGVTVSGLLNCLVLFVFRRPELRPSWRLVDRTAVRGLAVTGWLFFVLGAAGAIAYQTDALIVSSILGVGAVTTYNVPLRLMTLPGLLVSFVLTPLWPAYSEALARGDHRWLARTFRRSVFVASIVNIPTALLLLVFGRYAIHVWVGRQVSPPVLLLLALAAWTILNSLQGPIAMLLNGLSVVRFQVICAVSMAAANLAISIALTHRFGVAGPVVGTVVAQTLFITVPSVVYLRKRWRTMRRITRAVVEVAR